MLKQLRALKVIGVIGILWTATMLIFAVTPIASDDNFSMNPNTDLVVAAPGVLGNDTGFNSATHRIESYDQLSQFGNRVTLNGDGSFTFSPAAGFNGTDTFTYTVRTDEGGATAIVTINLVGPLHWFVDDSATPGGAGTYARPFNSFASLNSAATDVDSAGDRIFVYAGSYALDFTLEANQHLIGEAAGLTLVESGITIAAGTAPNLTSASSFPIVTLASGVTVNGLNFSNNNGHALRGSSVANITLTNLDIASSGANNGGIELVTTSGTNTFNDVDISGSTPAGATALRLVSNSGTINLTGSTISSFTGGDVLVIGGNAGTITFDSNSDINAGTAGQIEISTQTATGVVTLAGVTLNSNLNSDAALLLLNNNANSVVNFEEGFNITTTGTDGVAFTASGAGRVKIAGTGSTLSAADGMALELSGIELTQNATLASISSTSSPTDGILISNPVGNNDIIVTGTTTITGASDNAIEIVDTSAGFLLSLNTLTASSTGGVSVTFAALTVSNSASTLTATAGRAILADNAVLDLSFTTLTSTAAANAIQIGNSSGTITSTGGTLNSTSGTNNHVVNIFTSTVAFTYGGTVSKSTTGRVVSIDGLTNPGAVTFNGTVTATNASSGMSITNSSRPVVFTTLNLGTSAARFAATPITLAGNTGAVSLGNVSIFTAAVTALNINYANASPGAVNSTSGVLDATGNTAALTVSHATAQPLGLTLTTVSAPGAGTHGVSIIRASGTLSVTGTSTFGAKTAAGIQINNSSLATTFREVDIAGSNNGVTLLTNTGSFTISGDGTAANVDGAGGTFTNLINHGFVLNDVTNLTINDLQINTTGDHGITGQAVNGMVIDNLDLTLAGNADNEHALNFKDGTGANLVGTVSITDSTFTTFAENGIYVENFNGTLNMTVANSTFNETDAHTYCSGLGCDSHGMLIRSDGVATMTILIDNVTFDDITQVGIDAAREATSTLNITVQNSRFDPTPYTGISLNDTDNAVRFFSVSGSSGTFEFLIQNNVMGDTADGDDADGDDFRGTGGIILVRGGGPGTTLRGRILNNVVTDSRNSNGIAVESNGATAGSSTTRVRVEGNTIRNYFNQGMNVLANSSVNPADVHVLDVALMNNSVQTSPLGVGVWPINVSGGDYNRMCIRVTGNFGPTIGSPLPIGAGGNRMRIRHTSTPAQGLIQLETLTAFTAGNDGSAAAAVAADNNASSPISFFTSNAVTSTNCQADLL